MEEIWKDPTLQMVLLVSVIAAACAVCVVVGVFAVTSVCRARRKRGDPYAHLVDDENALPMGPRGDIAMLDQL